ncbi:cyanophycinase [Chryseobacterium sp. SORGH_AS 447]|uniref:cyanophycinase n=1 Tax=Chryseobacterium sp. SORGH_AS_0447 TaxID=3041769 RepID=UPI00278165DB|nr:cyanophycinase [Chryseobacterium sp. SORGH_AS_0447]MDQ1161487.1 cyanophycinase [Chryseobacterium sp. SORGH_AS_0447]
MDPKGKLLIIGGNEDKEGNKVPIQDDNKDFSPYQILGLLAASHDDRIEVITSASSEPESLRETYAKTFAEIGYTNVGFIHLLKENADKYYDRLSNAKTVFFTGGDQNRICKEIRETSVAALLMKKYLNEEGFMIAGTSAGAMCMPEHIICDALDEEAILENDLTIGSGLGFLKNCIVDTHFVNRGRIGRLAHAVTLRRECLGIGLGEDTALLIENGSHAVCKGSGMVMVLNPRQIQHTNCGSVEKGHPVFVDNVILSILTDGCRISLSSGQLENIQQPESNDKH